MSEETDPIREYLFEYIKNSKSISQLIMDKDFDGIISDVVSNCYDVVITMGEHDDVICTMATILLHYTLTLALVTSQRKVTWNGVDLDIIVPDTKTLEQDPKRTLVICISKASNSDTIEEEITQLKRVQPELDNIWFVLSSHVSTARRTFILSKNDNSFSGIVSEIAKFANISGTGKFKILKI